MFRLAPQPLGESEKTTMNTALSARVSRFLVLGPTLVLSIVLSGFHWSILPRVSVCIAFGSLLILLVARHQRRHLS